MSDFKTLGMVIFVFGLILFLFSNISTTIAPQDTSCREAFKAYSDASKQNPQRFKIYDLDSYCSQFYNKTSSDFNNCKFNIGLQNFVNGFGNGLDMIGSGVSYFFSIVTSMFSPCSVVGPVLASIVIFPLIFIVFYAIFRLARGGG